VTTDLPPTADVVVVGGGVVGAATAFHLTRAGLRPVIVEARPALCTLTTPVAAGAFRLQFESLEELTLVRESVELFLNFEDVTAQRAYRLGVRQPGYLWLTAREDVATRQREIVTRLRGWGQGDVEVLDGEEVRRRFGFVGPDVIQGRFRHGDGFLDTKALTYGLAAASGAAVVLDTRVTGFGTSGNRLTTVQTTRGDIAAGAAVIAAGPLSGRVAATGGVRLSVRMVRRHKLWVPGLAAVPPDAPMTIDEDTGAHWRPAFGGAWVLFPDPSERPGPPEEAVPVDPASAFRVLDPASSASVARKVPFWRDVWEHGAHQWMLQAGQYTMTPDRRPLIGPTGVEGLYVNTGYSGHGIMLSPAGSRLLADVVSRPSEPNPFALDRTFVPTEPALL